MSISKRYDHHFRCLITTPITLFLISSSILSPILPIVLASSTTSSSSSNLHRVDPSQHFKYYDGGYDLHNKHYWASAAFTGIHGYAVAGALLLCGLGFCIFAITNYFICNANHSSSATTTNHSDTLYYVLLILLLLFTILAMVATGFALATNQKTLHRTNKLRETVIGGGNVARRKIHKVNKVMEIIQNLLMPYDQNICSLLNTTSYQLGTESRSIKQFMLKNGHLIDQAIWASYLMNVVVVATNLLFLMAGIVLLFLHWHPGLFIFIFLCWILTMACWALTGIDFFLHTFAEDTCSALQDFMNNPLNSSLSSLLPCADALKSQTIIAQLSHTVHDFITQLNSNMNVITGISKEVGLLTAVNYDSNVLGNRQICDPFGGPPDYQYLAGICPKHAIQIRDLPEILARFTCNEEMSSKSCLGSGKFLPRTTYLMAYAYIQSVQNLIDIYPDLDDLIHCSVVKIPISDVVLNQCKPYKLSTRLLWTSILCLSIAMTILLLLWTIKAYQDQGKSFSNCSIFPRHEEP